MRTDGQRDVTKLILTFCNSVKAPKKGLVRIIMFTLAGVVR